MIRENTDNFEFVELTREDTLRALESARSDGVRGGLIHDYLHVAAAHKANADHICNYNVSDFRLFTKLGVGMFCP
jgi:hypothetical protein